MTEIRGRPFQKGKSGNPAGKPKGARHRATVAAETLLDGDAEAITRKAAEMAKNGDGTALRLCLERILPPRRERPIQFDLPKLENISDAPAAIKALATAVAAGEISSSEAVEFTKLIDSFVRASEALELESRVRELEEWKANQSGYNQNRT